ncbi:hypothetical protein CsSME_00000654 [Camellia sinensis var. sinensis]
MGKTQFDMSLSKGVERVLGGGRVHVLPFGLQTTTALLVSDKEIENLPDAKSVTEEMALVLRSSRLQKFWNSSVYYLKDEGQKDYKK